MTDVPTEGTRDGRKPGRNRPGRSNPTGGGGGGVVSGCASRQWATARIAITAVQALITLMLAAVRGRNVRTVCSDPDGPRALLRPRESRDGTRMPTNIRQAPATPSARVPRIGYCERYFRPAVAVGARLAVTFGSRYEPVAVAIRHRCRYRVQAYRRRDIRKPNASTFSRCSPVQQQCRLPGAAQTIGKNRARPCRRRAKITTSRARDFNSRQRTGEVFLGGKRKRLESFSYFGLSNAYTNFLFTYYLFNEFLKIFKCRSYFK